MDKIKNRSKQILDKTQVDDKVIKEVSEFKKELAGRTLKLVTSGFGLVSALAWNELIKEAVNMYIKPYFGKNSGLISLAIYAVIVTALAVLVTYQLGKLAKNGEED